MRMWLSLPPGVSPAIDQDHPVRCWALTNQTGTDPVGTITDVTGDPKWACPGSEADSIADDRKMWLGERLVPQLSIFWIEIPLKVAGEPSGNLIGQVWTPLAVDLLGTATTAVPLKAAPAEPSLWELVHHYGPRFLIGCGVVGCKYWP